MNTQHVHPQSLTKCVFALLCALSCLAIPVCSADDKKNALPQSRFLGTWVPIAKDRSGLKRIDITRSGKSWTIHVWAFATFTEIDWGTVPLHLLGSDVASRSFDYALAVWKPDFADKYMTLHIENNRLVVEQFTLFTDGSKRSNYRSIERFKRSL